MKKHVSVLVAAAFLFVCLTSIAFAKNGKGAGDGSGPLTLHEITGSFEYTGVIVSAGVPGDGMVIDVDGTLVTIYGLGPSWYWDTFGVDKLEALAIGETISVTGIVVDYDGVVRNLATTITIDGVTIDLRDANGDPLWK
jgi:hypothetical protein